MASDRTFVTELATGLGMVGDGDLSTVLEARPSVFTNLTTPDWDRLAELWQDGSYQLDFIGSFLNGQAFLYARDVLRGRIPESIEWTGARRAPGDEVVPSDLRIDHVYLVSCKYFSRILHNLSPARLALGLLTRAPLDDARDWYQRMAPVEYQLLYEACLDTIGDERLPAKASELSPTERHHLARRLQEGWPAQAVQPYSRLCQVIAEATAQEWSSRITARNGATMLWRILRIGAAPYFILGTSPSGSTRLRIGTPWDWHQDYRLRSFEIRAQEGGQPRVAWSAIYESRPSGEQSDVRGHVEIRWSHGRFAQRPEAKVYLDSPIENVPGYHLL